VPHILLAPLPGCAVCKIAKEVAGAIGIAPGRIHSELFGALALLNPGGVAMTPVAPHPTFGTAGTGPTVTFVRSGLTVNWSDRDGSLLDLAEACDVSTR
jgi:hypothetical protein